MCRTDNPVWDAMNKDDEDDKRLKSRPVCSFCGNHIQDEYYYAILGEKICTDCLSGLREWID